MTPTGSKKQAATVCTPVREVTTAEPPVRSMAVTLIVLSAKQLLAGVGGIQDVGEQAEDHESDVGIGAVSGPDDFEKGVGIGRAAFELDGKCSKEQDLHLPERDRYQLPVPRPKGR